MVTLQKKRFMLNEMAHWNALFLEYDNPGGFFSVFNFILFMHTMAMKKKNKIDFCNPKIYGKFWSISNWACINLSYLESVHAKKKCQNAQHFISNFLLLLGFSLKFMWRAWMNIRMIIFYIYQSIRTKNAFSLFCYLFYKLKLV